MPVHQDAPARHVIEAREQGAEGRLTGARGADEGDCRSGLDVQIDVPQHRATVGIVEGHPFEAQIACQTRGFGGPGAVLHVRIGREQLGVAPESGHPFGVGLDDGVDLLDGPQKDIHQQEEAHEAAGTQAAVQHEIRAGDQHHQLGEAQAEVAERGAGGHDPVALQFHVAVAGIVAGEEPLLVVLVGERLYHPYASDVLFDPDVEGAHRVEDRLPVAGHPAAHTAGEPQHHRDHGSGDQGETRVDRPHQDQCSQQRHDRDDQVLGTMVGDLTDLLQVLGEAADKLPGLVVIEIPEREPLHVTESPAAHFGLDVDAEHVAPVGHRGCEGSRQQVDGQQRERGQQDQAPGSSGEQPVDEGLDGDGEAEFQQTGEDGAAEVQQEQAKVRPVILEKLPEQRTGRGGYGGQRNRH